MIDFSKVARTTKGDPPTVGRCEARVSSDCLLARQPERCSGWRLELTSQRLSASSDIKPLCKGPRGMIGQMSTTEPFSTT